MTSGNLTDEPICYEDDDARRRLGPIADAWLLHDRPIHVPCDDSVLEIDPGSGSELPLRRSRGYAPLPVRLPFAARPTLAVGGELKNTFCLAAGNDAFMSQHIGDMGSLETWAAFERSTRQLAGLYGIRRRSWPPMPTPATRRHAGRRTHRRARWPRSNTTTPTSRRSWPSTACPRTPRVIGIAFDGTGFGTDGTIWGGEVLVAGYGDFARVGHLKTVPLPGGDAAVRRPCRAALAHLWAAGIEWAEDLPPAGAVSAEERAVLARQLERGTGCVATSSMGRLFDAVSSLLGLRHEASYEAEAALCLQWAAEEALDVVSPARPYRFDLTGDELDPSPVLRALVADLRRGANTGAMAAGFHAAVAHVIGDVAERQRARTGIDVVALSGGVFQNALLLGLARRELEARQFRRPDAPVVPPNDGGLALGQAAIAGYRAAAAGRGQRDGSGHHRGSPRGAGPAEDLAPAALALARRFAAGATLWCVAPQWPAHARHVAVEFVHPVIVGKRALPAVSIDGPGAAESVRLLSRPGDLLLCISTAADPLARDLVTRADAWGLTSLWLGAGPRPGRAGGDAHADHVVWLDGVEPALAARSGDLVLLYHLLWELTHVVFEHPGLLAPEAECADDVCVTCSDEGRVAEVRAVLAEGRVEVLAGGHAEQIDGRLVDGLRPGDLVLVHAGVAVTSLMAGRGP